MVDVHFVNISLSLCPSVCGDNDWTIFLFNAIVFEMCTWMTSVQRTPNGFMHLIRGENALTWSSRVGSCIVCCFFLFHFISVFSKCHPICVRHSLYGHNVNWLIFYYWSVNRILLLSLIISKIMTIRFSLFSFSLFNCRPVLFFPYVSVRRIYCPIPLT